jgi:hypothetical protein
MKRIINLEKEEREQVPIPGGKGAGRYLYRLENRESDEKFF